MRPGRASTSWSGLTLAAATLLVAVAPLPAQTAIPKVSTTSTTPRPVPSGGIPKRAVTTALSSGTLAAFKQSLEVSLDSAHWSKSITTSTSCAPGANAACVAGTPAINVYLRWIQLDPPTDMTAAHQQKQALVKPYVLVASGANASVCTTGNANAALLPGFPASIAPSGAGSGFPITCHWTVFAVSSTAQPPDYWLYPSTAVTVVVNHAP